MLLYLDRDDFRRALRSLIWFTYRNNFVSLGPNNGGVSFHSDSGWGYILLIKNIIQL